MKKLILSLILLNKLYATNWYIVDISIKPITCILEPLANPYKIKQMDVPVVKLREGIFKVILGDISIYLVNSKQNCKKLISLHSKLKV